jgi:2-C-methyl-D-erythritol 2,4-cyclodiphosphate synthase
MRIGFGYDLHRLEQGRALVLGGVRIPAPFGELGHSDGDVLLHAVIDALLGAACLGDIGSHFPPGDPAYRDISSRVLLERAVTLVRQAGFRIVNIDATVVLQAPKILPYAAEIRAVMASDLGIPVESVSVKGKTKEQVDATGEGRAVEAYAAVLLESI